MASQTKRSFVGRTPVSQNHSSESSEKLYNRCVLLSHSMLVSRTCMLLFLIVDVFVAGLGLRTGSICSCVECMLYRSPMHNGILLGRLVASADLVHHGKTHSRLHAAAGELAYTCTAGLVACSWSQGINLGTQKFQYIRSLVSHII